MNYSLEINLESAVSPGAGEGWAGMIDSDVVFDELGIPFIPARRIRGIMREMAADIVDGCLPHLAGSSPLFSNRDLDCLFGNAGQTFSSPLIIENAYPGDYQKIRQWLEWANAKMTKLIFPERVMDTFTHLRQQTAIEPETGAAKPASLRTTRVLNKGLTFYSAIEIHPHKTEYEMLLALSAQVTRRLGGKRNRGLGKISCKLMDNTSDVTQKWLTHATTHLSKD